MSTALPGYTGLDGDEVGYILAVIAKVKRVE
jgi:hypothetical protein